jgi:hypothetical protein
MVNLADVLDICPVDPHAGSFEGQIGEFQAVNVVRKMILSIKIFITLLDYLKIPQVAILGELHI